MPLFKFLEPHWADQMVDVGSVRIGTLYDFRRIESLGAERGDKDEGVRISLTDGKAGLVAGEDLPSFVSETLRILPGTKIYFAEGAVLKVYQNSPDMYVCCVCSKFDKSLMERFGGACVEIVHPERYFAPITQALDGWTREGIRKISGFRLAACQYLPREQTWPKVIPYDPVFRKPPEYSHHREVRAAWSTPVAPISPVNLLVPDIRSCCRRIA